MTRIIVGLEATIEECARTRRELCEHLEKTERRCVELDKTFRFTLDRWKSLSGLPKNFVRNDLVELIKIVGPLAPTLGTQIRVECEIIDLLDALIGGVKKRIASLKSNSAPRPEGSEFLLDFAPFDNPELIRELIEYGGRREELELNELEQSEVEESPARPKPGGKTDEPRKDDNTFAWRLEF